MFFDEIIDRIIKARADVIHADKVLAQWDLRTGEGPDANEYSLLVNLIKHAGEILDSVVSGIVKTTAEMTDSAEPGPTHLRSRNRVNPSRPS